MSVSTGALSAVKEAAVWVVAAGLLVASIVYSRDVLSFLRGGADFQASATEERAQTTGLPASPSEGSDLAVNEGSPRSIGPDDAGAVTDDGGGAESSNSGFERIVRIEAESNGHFVTEASINGSAVEVVVDTGATGVALSYEDAEAIGIRLSDADYTLFSETANGRARIALVKLDEIRIGDVVVEDVEAYVAEPGKLFGTLLGMSFLSRISRVDMRGRELVLEQ